MADGLPHSFLHISQTDPTFLNWQPLFWKGFQQTTRYTYRVDLNKSLKYLKSAITDKTRNRIHSAIEKVEIRKSTGISDLFQLIQFSFNRQNQSIPFTLDFLTRLHDVLSFREASTAYLAYHKDQPVAGIYTIRDKTTTYLLLTGRSDKDPGGAVGALIWESIRDAHNIGQEIFDFEGSMIENIESFFRSFGGEQTPYHRLSRTSGKGVFLILKLLNRL